MKLTAVILISALTTLIVAHLFGWLGHCVLCCGAAVAVTLVTLYGPLSRQVSERIVVNGRGIRLSRHVRGRLIEQRRIKSAGLAIEVTQDAARRSMAITLCEQPRRALFRRRFEIARTLTAEDRASFLECFVDGLRRSGENPQIFVRCGRQSGERVIFSAAARRRRRFKNGEKLSCIE